jgi:predicted amidohydrolase
MRMRAMIVGVALLVIASASAAHGGGFNVALLQMTPDTDHVEANADKAEDFCRQAAKKGADLALMPEMWSIGYTRPDPAQAGSREAFENKAVKKDGPYLRRFSELARELDMAIGVTYLEDNPAGLRNTLTVFDRHGAEVLTYAKIHTSDFKHMEANMTPGDAFFTGTLDTHGGPVKIGAMICFDREQPESARILMLQGAEIILTPNACHLDELRLDQFKVRAFENQLGVAMANYPGDHYEGRSVAYAPDGACLVLAGSREGLYLARFNMEKIRAQRAKSIWGNAYRRPHRYAPLVSAEKDPVWARIDGNGQPYDASKR